MHHPLNKYLVAPHRLATGITMALLGATSVQAGDHRSMEEIIVYEGSALGGLNLNAASEVGGRLGLSLQDTPASVEIIGSSTINARGDHDTLSAVTRSTGMTPSATPGNGGTAVSARGFSGHGSVITAYDGTRLHVGAGTVSFPADTWLLDRVEILRGPGSVTHGIGATGATINYVTKKPDLASDSANATLSGGSHGLWRAGFGGNLVVSDTVALRADLLRHDKDGHVDHSDERRDLAAVSALFSPNSELQLTLSLDYADINAAPYWGTPVIDGRAPSRIRDNNYNVSDAIVAYEDLWPRLKLEWHVSDNLLLRNDTYYIKAKRHWRNLESYDYNPASGQIDRSFYLEIKHDQEQLGTRSDALLDFSLGGMENSLSIGFELNQVDFSHANNSPYMGSSSVPLEHFDPGSFFEGSLSETSLDYLTDSRFYALFADNVLKINPRWSLVAGLRYDRVDYERVDVERSNGQGQDDFDARFEAMSYRLGAVFSLSDSTSLYAQYSTAPDAIGSIASLNASQQDLDLTKGEQVEAGIKQQLWDGRAEYTLAAFHITKKDLFTQPSLSQDVEQVGKQKARGIEFSLGARPLDSLGLNFNTAWVQGEYGDYANQTGNTPRNVPEWTANLWLNWALTDKLSLDSGLRYVGARYSNDSNSAELPDYLTLDASLHWQLTEGITVFGRGKNLTDEQDYVISTYGSQWILGEPRSFEVGVNFDF